ncbi:MAG: polyphosphate kinase 1 [Bacteroidota bacterium]
MSTPPDVPEPAAPAASGDGTALPGLAFSVPQATSPKRIPKRAKPDHPGLYFNRELSWLDFNWRVLYQAIDERTPLLERVRFLSITSSNLDEFFRKRVGGLKRQAAAGVSRLTPDGRTPLEQLTLIRPAVVDLYRTMSSVWEDRLRPRLRTEAGLHVCDYAELSADDQAYLHRYFQAQIFPILTPLAVDPGHPFPFISNLSLSLAVMLRHPTRETEHFARLKVPLSRGRWVPLPRPLHYVPLEQVIAHNLHETFRGMDVLSVHAFQVTRNADLRRDEEEAEDLIEMISDELRERRFAPVVRLEIEADMPPRVRQLLTRELELEPDDIYEAHGLLDHSDCAKLADVDLPAFKYTPWEPVTPSVLQHERDEEDRSMFGIIQERDLLVHHPYESFRMTTQRLLEEAAVDPQVLSIKQTLYRTSDESPVMSALIRAAENGKLVAVLVEVKARFDEENNIGWGQRLEKAGVHVTYGLVGLKTHAKTTLIIREEEDGLRTYCHLGTGNYNPKTANLYTDFGLFTASPDIGYDLINLFHYLTGYAPEQHYRRLLVAPRDMRKRFIDLIHREIKHQRKQGTGRIMAKMNALDDVELIQEMYRASKAGVQIDLVVRGHCRLRPGVPHLSENIRVVSIVGRFLEHTRAYYFHNNGDPEVFTGSADWQRRNLDDRVEAIINITDPVIRGRLTRTMEFALADRRLAWQLHPDGHYEQYLPQTPDEEESYHDLLMRRFKDRSHGAGTPWDIQ